jgi:hypothetical protein
MAWVTLGDRRWITQVQGRPPGPVAEPTTSTAGSFTMRGKNDPSRVDATMAGVYSPSASPLRSTSATFRTSLFPGGKRLKLDMTVVAELYDVSAFKDSWTNHPLTVNGEAIRRAEILDIYILIAG